MPLYADGSVLYRYRFSGVDPVTMMKQLRYIRERMVNAWWMVRHGEFRQMVGAVLEEIGHRRDDVRLWWARTKPKKMVRVLSSIYEDNSRIIPPSRRPTALRPSSDLEANADLRVVHAEIVAIRRSLFIGERDAV